MKANIVVVYVWNNKSEKNYSFKCWLQKVEYTENGFFHFKFFVKVEASKIK